VPERTEGRLAVAAVRPDGTVYALPLFRNNNDGSTYVQEISKFKNKGALVKALAETYKGQKGFSLPSLRKLIINEAPFATDGTVNQEQMGRLYSDQATRDKWTPVVQRALDMGILKVGTKRTKLSEFLAANDMVSSGTAVVTYARINNPTRIGSPLESIALKVKPDLVRTAKDAVKSVASSAGISAKRASQIADRLDLVPKEKLDQVRVLLASGSETAQAEVEKIIGTRKGDTPEFTNKLFTAGDKAKQVRDVHYLTIEEAGFPSSRHSLIVLDCRTSLSPKI
jgi:hypothetical protein